MALNRDKGISVEHYSGQSKIHDRGEGGLSGVIRSILQKQGAVVVDAASITALTDSSTGTDNSTVGAISSPAVADVSGGTTGVLATGAGSIDTSADTVMNAYNALLQQANLVYAEVGAGDVAEGPGTATLPTVAAVDQVLAANTTDNDSLDFVTFTQIRNELLDAQATVISNVNRCRRIVGLAEITVAAGGGLSQATVYPGDGVPVTALTNGAAIAGGVTSVLKTAADAMLVELADNIAYFATSMDEVTGVVATTAIGYYAD